MEGRTHAFAKRGVQDRKGGRVLRLIARWFVVALYFVAGVAHLADPAPFLSIMPDWVPYPAPVVSWTGIAELVGAIALAQWKSRDLQKAGAIGLALYAVCVFPANINHFVLDMGRPDQGLGLAYHVPRMVAQPLLVWLTLWAGRVIEWPFTRRTNV